MGDSLSIPVEDLPFRRPVINTLLRAKITTVGDLVEWRREDLLLRRDFGRRSLAVVEDFLRGHGLKLKE